MLSFSVSCLAGIGVQWWKFSRERLLFLSHLMMGSPSVSSLGSRGFVSFLRSKSIELDLLFSCLGVDRAFLRNGERFTVTMEEYCPVSAALY